MAFKGLFGKRVDLSTARECGVEASRNGASNVAHNALCGKKKIVVGWIKKDEQFFFKIQKVSEKSRKAVKNKHNFCQGNCK